MIYTAATSWPEAVSYFAIALAVVGVVWALVWGSVQSGKHDPFWNRGKTDEDKNES